MEYTQPDFDFLFEQVAHLRLTLSDLLRSHEQLVANQKGLADNQELILARLDALSTNVTDSTEELRDGVAEVQKGVDNTQAQLRRLQGLHLEVVETIEGLGPQRP